MYSKTFRVPYRSACFRLSVAEVNKEVIEYCRGRFSTSATWPRFINLGAILVYPLLACGVIPKVTYTNVESGQIQQVNSL